MIEELEKWLTEPVYWQGVELYARYGSSAMLKRLFRGASDDFNKRKLGQELTALLEAARTERDTRPVRVVPPAVQDMKARAQSLMDERSALKERARVLVSQGVVDGPELLGIAYGLSYDIREELDRVYGQVRFWEVNDYLPDTGPVAVVGVADLVRRRNTLRTYVSRSPGSKKLKQWKAELFEIEQKLSELGQENPA